MGKRVVIISSLFVTLSGLAAGFVLYLRSQGQSPLPPEALALPADSSILMGVDARRLAASELYRRLGAELPQPPLLEALRQQAGLALERDVDQILVSLANPGTPRPQLVLLLQGRFDRRRLTAFVQGLPEVTREQQHGIGVFTLRQGESVALLDDRTLAIGRTARLNALIADRAARREPLRSNESLLAATRRLQPGRTLWLAGGSSLVGELQRNVPRARTSAFDLATIESLTLSADVEPAVDLEASVEVRDRDTAEQIATLLRGFAAMASLGAAQSPELVELASKISVTTDDRRVQVKVQLAHEQLERALRPLLPPRSEPPPAPAPQPEADGRARAGRR